MKYVFENVPIHLNGGAFLYLVQTIFLFCVFGKQLPKRFDPIKLRAFKINVAYVKRTLANLINGPLG